MAPKRQGKTINCDHCGKEIYRPLAQIKALNFCSVECRSRGQRGISNPNGKPKTLKRCEICGVEFPVSPYQEKRRYCSKPCTDIAKGGSIETQCHYCGAPLVRQAHRTKNATHQFCNNTCRGAWQSTQVGPAAPAYKGTTVRVQCSQCGKELKRDTSKLQRNQDFFCGAECWNQWRKVHMRRDGNPNWKEPIQTHCATCGAPIERNAARVGTETRKVHFCSKACKYQWMSKAFSGPNNYAWKGGCIDYYGPNWREQKRLARQRDGNRCQVCGKTAKKNGRDMDVHHIKPFRSFDYLPDQNLNYEQANALDNLICLCRACHKKAESGKIAVQPNLL